MYQFWNEILIPDKGFYNIECLKSRLYIKLRTVPNTLFYLQDCLYLCM